MPFAKIHQLMNNHLLIIKNHHGDKLVKTTKHNNYKILSPPPPLPLLIHDTVVPLQIDSDPLHSTTQQRRVELLVLLALFNMFLLLLLSFGIKTLTLAITLSAFFLFFLVDKKVFRFTKDDSNQIINRMTYEFRNLQDIQCQNEEVKETTKLKDLLMDKDDDFVFESERSKSKRDKIKSKMRNCFLKKTQKNPHRPQIVCQHHINQSQELEMVQCNNQDESNNRFSINSTNANCGFYPTFKMDEGIREQESVKIWTCLVLVLIGLVQSRAFALLLTLSWFFLLKLGETVSRHLKDKSGFCI